LVLMGIMHLVIVTLVTWCGLGGYNYHSVWTENVYEWSWSLDKKLRTECFWL